MPRGAALSAAVLAVSVALGGCGEGDDAPARSVTQPGVAVELELVFEDGRGDRSSGTLTCRDGVARSGGDARDRAPAEALCAKARELAGFLTSSPPARRACTQIYGGPQTARISGTIGGEAVDRRFRRTNGCEIADFTRVAGLLPR